MSITATLQAQKRALSVDPLNPRDPALAEMFGSRSSLTGLNVTADTALSSSAVYAGVRFIAENMASVPLKLYRIEGRGKTPARDDPRWGLLQYDPNPEQTSLEFREMLVGFVVLIGNAYAEIVEDRAGNPAQLWPIVPWRVYPRRGTTGRLTYWVRQVDGTEAPIPPERMLHFRGFSRDGLLGDNVVDRMREALGLTIAAERSAAAFFGHGAQPSGILRTEKALSEKAVARLKEAANRIHGGVENWHRIAVLEEGTEWQQISTDPEKAQLIETRKFQVTEVSRILNLPPHILKDLERSTFSNIEHQGQELVVYSLRPWAVRIEQVLEKRLLLPRERGTHIIRHNLEGFLRGVMEARYNSYAVGRQWGWLSANDVRELEDQNPIGPEGDIYMAPINMLPADQFTSAGLANPGQEPPPEPVGRTERRDASRGRAAAIRKRTEASMRPVFRQRLDELFRREANAIRRALAKAANGGGVQEFLAWMDGFYEENARFQDSSMKPLFTSLALAIYQHAADEVGASGEPAGLDTWVAGWAERFGRQESEDSAGQIRALVRDAPLFEDAQVAVETRVAEWEAGRGEKVAGREIVTLGAKAALLAFADGGVRVKVWFANGDSCPLCRQMHGRTVSISEPFLRPGDELENEGDASPLRVERNFAAPSLHGGCDCTVVAGS